MSERTALLADFGGVLTTNGGRPSKPESGNGLRTPRILPG